MKPIRRLDRGLSMATVLLVVAIAPTVVMLTAISLALYVSRSNEIRSDLAERGALTTAALAETSTYGVVSGNVEALRGIMQGLLTADRSIARAEVLDDQRRPLATAESSNPRSTAPISFERPIRAHTMAVDVFADLNNPHLSLPAAPSAAGSEGRILGYARISMSLESLVEAKWRYLRLTSLVLLVAAVVGLLFALTLIHRLHKPLASVVDALRHIRNGKYEISVGLSAKGEMGELQDTVVEVAQALRATTSGLEATVAQRTIQLREAVDLANRSNKEKRELIVESNRRLEEERRRIALEIHDSMNSALIVVRLKAQHIEHLAAIGVLSEGAKDIRQCAKDIAGSVEVLYASARAIAKQLRPEVIDMLGLLGALAELIRSYDEIHPDCRFVLAAPRALPELHGDDAITAYRLVQESLSNVVKHSNATSVHVDVKWQAHRSAIVMKIIDNGVGFDPDASPEGGLGLIGMRERVLGVGGTMDLQAAKGSGTSVTFVVPTRMVFMKLRHRASA
ncbi:Signal transduction histidine-protein kinase/phosphatase DegS [Variovorax sp. SRS16]|uniref:ATP-binding protein n=1 Tax=Variovorax sp. SRS16 TaxID=282217 RepID=UPI001319B05D|nr:ATP-binding protein [Variovorax sp. SRS16]VTU19885.1 Signal transduction histidine-protein kinase/phosphatase DegS [Variovorax sp. SRS16]